MITAEQLQANLAHCTGTEQWYQHPLGIHYTDGVKMVADKAEAYWLIDEIASYQRENLIQHNRALREFQLWTLTVHANLSATLVCYPDSPETCEPAMSQHIKFTDFPLREIKLYVENGTLLLPSEH